MNVELRSKWKGRILESGRNFGKGSSHQKDETWLRLALEVASIAQLLCLFSTAQVLHVAVMRELRNNNAVLVPSWQ
jgi:hypothetical protein